MRSQFLSLVTVLGMLVLAGCGGGGASSGTGFVTNASFEINWPARTRSSPINALSSAESVAVSFTNAGAGGGNVVMDIDRPATQVNAYTGSYTVPQPLNQTTTSMTLLFYAGAGETGSIVGNATATISLASGTVNVATISLNTIIKSVSIVSPGTVVAQTAPFQMQFSALDASGATVAVSAGSASWTLLSGASSVTLTPDGILTPNAAGNVQVQVAVDGVTSSPVAFTISPPAMVPRTLSLSTNSLLQNPVTGTIYATVPGSSNQNANQLVVIDPVAGKVTSAISPGSDPDQMGVSSDGSELYVALDGQMAVREVNTADMSMNPAFNLAAKDAWGQGDYYVDDLLVQPGNSNEIAVETQEYDSTGDSGPAVYLNGTELTKIAGGYSGDSMVWPTAGTIFTVTVGFSPVSLYEFGVGSTGVTQESDQFEGPFNGPIKCFGSTIYGTDGVTADASTGVKNGQFVFPQVQNGIGYSAMDMTVDTNAKEAFFLTEDIFNQQMELLVYDTTTYDLLTSAAVNLPNTNYASGLCRFGSSGLAFRTGSAVYFLDNVPGLVSGKARPARAQGAVNRAVSYGIPLQLSRGALR